MANMMAYKMSMYMVFFNFSMIIANYIGTLIFPTNTPHVSTYNNALLDSATTFVFSQFASTQGILGLVFTAGLMSLFAFSLLIPTIPFVSGVFALSGIIMAGYISQLPIPGVFTAPLIAGVGLITFMGISQYSARSTVQGA